MDVGSQAQLEQLMMGKADEFLEASKELTFYRGFGELFESGTSKLTRSELVAVLTAAYVIWSGQEFNVEDFEDE